MNYQESTVTGTSWVRCKAVTISNPLEGADDAAPSVNFYEEKVVVSDGDYTRIPVGGCRKVFDAAGVITVLNPDTDAPTGSTMTHGELYAVLYSLYMQTALERDMGQ